MRKCSMCGEYKKDECFRFMKHQNRYNAYCTECERWYQKHYVRKQKKHEATSQILESVL